LLRSNSRNGYWRKMTAAKTVWSDAGFGKR